MSWRDVAVPTNLNSGPWLTAYTWPALAERVASETVALPICSMSEKPEEIAKLGQLVLPPLFHEAFAEDAGLRDAIVARIRECFPYMTGSGRRARTPGRLEVEANEKFAMQAPDLLVALFSPRPVTKIPLWEQQLSCGAVCFNILNAAGALGFEAGWVTGWAAYSDVVLRAFGTAEERIAGFIFIGTAAAPLEERPRPALDEIYSEWSSA